MHGPYEREVYYYETDRMQIVHHSNYARWLEEARMWFMKEIGYDYPLLEAKGILIPVLSVETQFRKAFKYGDTFQIYLSSVKFNGIKSEFKYEIRNKENGELYTTGRSSHCFTDVDLKPFNMKKLYPQMFADFASYVEKEER